MAEGDNINEFVYNFRTHSHKVILLDKLPPDFVLEHQVRQRAFYLKTRSGNHPLRLTSRSAKDAIIDSRLEI